MAWVNRVISNNKTRQDKSKYEVRDAIVKRRLREAEEEADDVAN